MTVFFILLFQGILFCKVQDVYLLCEQINTKIIVQERKQIIRQNERKEKHDFGSSVMSIVFVSIVQCNFSIAGDET